ncbi:MAG: sulfatase-like hydrolase/transferase [Nitrospinales bacterium]
MKKKISKPNILFILSDQQRWDTLGCYGQKLNVTPELDKIASQGVRFEYAFTPQPLCGPARACIQTGKYPTQTGNYRNFIALPKNEKTIAHFLCQAGYKVAYIGKWHLASTNLRGVENADFRTVPIPANRRGGYKDYWLASDVLEFTSHGYGGRLYDSDMKEVDFEGYRADCLTDFAVDYIRAYNSSDPFFLFLSFVEPHYQNDCHCFQGPKCLRERFENYNVPEDLKDAKGDWQDHFLDYLACCRSVDYNVGRLYKELANNKIVENTILIYTSDHGCHFKTRNSEYKRSCHESSIRIPLIICGKKFKGGKTVEKLVSLIDLAPTILNIAHIDQHEYMPGRPLSTLISGDTNWPNEVFIQISESKLARAIRTDRWKYSVYAPDKDPVSDSCSNIYVEDFLYDLAKDPHESNNVVNDPNYKHICSEMKKILIDYIFKIERISASVMPNDKTSL